MTGKNWKTLALWSLVATTFGADAQKHRLRRANEKPHQLHDMQIWESAPEITLPENVEEVNWFVDKDGRELVTTLRPLTELVAQTFVLQFMEAALVFSGLANVLNGPGPFTMIITWDYQWDRQPYINKFKTAPWRAHLREMLEHVIFEGDVPQDGLPDSRTLYMMNGEAVTLTFDGSRSRINGYRNIGTTEVTNGYVYLLQDIIEPSFLSKSRYDVISSDHSVFASLLVAAGRHGLVQNTAESVGFTVFAPTNSAFDKVSTGFVTYLSSSTGRTDRDDLLDYHMAVPVYPTLNMYPNSNIPLTTREGSQLTMRLSSSGTLTITAAQSTATVTNKDKLAYNGIIHVVDTVLLLKNPGSIATPAPLNVETYIRSIVPNTSVFNNNNNYQKKALDWVKGNCDGCGVDGDRIRQRYVLACINYATNNVPNALTSSSAVSVSGQWLQRSGWMSSDDECTWYGIDCNDSGYVDYINLRENRLTGTFPSETSLLANNLEVLDLTQNWMYNDGSAGNDWLGDLTNLKYLSVSQTGFSYDGIPPAIGRLTELTDLDVSYCLYLGTLRASVFTNLDKVTYLDISGNSYGSSAPSTIGSMSSLLYFYAIDTDLEGNMSFITSSSSVMELWIDDNPNFGGNIPSQIGNMRSLVSLSLSDNNLVGSIPTHIGNCLNLKQVWFYGNSLVGSIPTHVGRLSSLVHFEVFENSINSGSMPNQVCQLPALDTLSADCTGTGFSCSCCSCCRDCRRSGDTA